MGVHGPSIAATGVKLRNEYLTAMASSGSKVPYQRTGFVPFAESLNGRLAMLGFVIAIATEALSGKGILGQLGLG
jgi:ferrochelatase